MFGRKQDGSDGDGGDDATPESAVDDEAKAAEAQSTGDASTQDADETPSFATGIRQDTPVSRIAGPAALQFQGQKLLAGRALKVDNFERRIGSQIERRMLDIDANIYCVEFADWYPKRHPTT